MQKADQNANLEMDFAEFVQYMTQHEMKLKLAFSHLDRNQDGTFHKFTKLPSYKMHFFVPENSLKIFFWGGGSF